ncbi:Fic family protein [Candidatus Roizmanbacteria bacterium]|nr:Fic family protein [Candidatus Roizmanbacteria bacterium]
MYKPHFTITAEINNWVAQIQAIKKKFELSRLLPSQEIVLRYRAAVESIHSSTRIEGNPLAKQEVESALAGKMNAFEKKVIEVVNYKKAWDWIEKRGNTKSNITLKDILKLHSLAADRLLPEHKIGTIRSGPVYIVDSKETVRYTAPKSHEVKKLIEELLDWLNDKERKLHPVLTAAILHYEFVSIHPFADINGRVTRLLVKLFLNLLNYDFRGCLVLDTYYWQHLNSYYQVLNQGMIYKDQRNADLTPWVSFFSEGFYQEVKDLERKIDILNVGRGSSTSKIVRLNDEEIQILDFIKQFGQITLEDSLDILRLSIRTIQRRLRTLVDKKILVKRGKGKNTYYIFQSKRL